ncbi:hypothetical protein PMAYCL1PPCAC_01359, partial [Pristionchus mayeri]
GAQEYNMPYSMNKRKRWTVPDLFEEMIEEVQDPSRSLRVSASVHSMSTSGEIPILQRPPWGWRYGISQVEELPTQEYHDVLRDGKVKHREHEHARLITIDRDPKEKEKRRRGPEIEPVSDRNLPFDDNERFQKAHVRYNVTNMVHDKRKVHRYNLPTFDHWWSYDTTLRDKERAKKNTVWKEMCDLNKDGFDDDVIWADDDCDDVITPGAATLADCVVEKKLKKRSRKHSHSAKARFVDEVRVRVSFPEKIVSQEDEEEFEIVPTSSNRLTASDSIPAEEVEGVCPICIEPFSEQSRSFSLSCPHSFCVSCWLRQAQVCLDAGCDEVACMDPQCSEILTKTLAKRLLSPDSLARLLHSTQESRLRKGKARRCPQCRWIVDYTSSRVDSCSCGALLCGGCSSLFHGSLPCDKAAQYNEYLKNNGMDKMLGSSLSSNIVTELVRCPACTTPLQRSIGCDHMTCVCGASFCFRCGKERDLKHDIGGACKQKEMETVVLLDVFTRAGVSSFTKRQLAEAVRRRVELAMRKREISEELGVLPLSAATKYMRKIEAISVLLECTILRSIDSKEVGRIELALYRFLSSKKCNGGEVRDKLKKRADALVNDCFDAAKMNSSNSE